MYVWQKRALVAQLPKVTTKQEARSCAELQMEAKQARARGAVVTDYQIQTACALHMSGAACASCLGRRP